MLVNGSTRSKASMAPGRAASSRAARSGEPLACRCAACADRLVQSSVVSGSGRHAELLLQSAALRRFVQLQRPACARRARRGSCISARHAPSCSGSKASRRCAASDSAIEGAGGEATASSPCRQPRRPVWRRRCRSTSSQSSKAALRTAGRRAGRRDRARALARALRALRRAAAARSSATSTVTMVAHEA